MPDAKLERLGNYFVHCNIAANYGITFERFVQLVELGTWEDYVK